MMLEERGIAVLIDHENVHSTNIDIEQLFSLVAPRGRILIKRAYGDWSRFSSSKHLLLKLGIDLIELPSSPRGKNRADIRLVVDAMEIVFTRPHISTFVLISGDSDFVQLASKLRELNRQVVFVAMQCNASALLKASCDDLILLDSDQIPATKKTCKSRDKKLDLTRLSVLSKPSKLASTPSKDDYLADRLLNAISWSMRSIDAGKEEYIHISRFAQMMQRLFPDVNLTDFGFRKSGCWLKLAQVMEQDGWCDLCYDTERRLYLIRPAERLLQRTATSSTPTSVESLLAERETRAAQVMQAIKQSKSTLKTNRSLASPPTEEEVPMNQMILPFE